MVGFGLMSLACGGQATDTGTVPIADAGPEDVHVEAEANTPLPLPCGITQAGVDALAAAQVQADLESRFARYVQGDIAVYQGTASAHDNASALPGFSDGALSEQPVIGALRQSEPELAVAGQTDAKWFWVRESLTIGHANVGMVLDFGQSGGSYGETTQAVPSFWDASAPAFEFQAHADGLWGDATTAFAIDVEVALQRVPPASVTLDHVLRLQAADGNLAVGPFVKKEARAELVWATTASQASCTPPGSGYLEGECSLVVELTAVEFVDPSDLSKYGYDALQISKASVCCSHCDAPAPEGCGAGFKYDCYP